MSTPEIRLQEPENDSGNSRRYSLSDAEWTYLFCVVYLTCEAGGAASVYTSRDRNALCVSIKAGKDRRAYWIGPDDSPALVLDRIVVEWGIRGEVPPLDETLGAG